MSKQKDEPFWEQQSESISAEEQKRLLKEDYEKNLRKIREYDEEHRDEER